MTSILTPIETDLSRFSWLRSQLRRLSQPGEFVRNLATLMTGTVFSQLILIAVSFILTRLYTPEDFGKLGVFVGLASILGVFSTMRYHFAIVIADDEEEARNIFSLCVLLTSVTAAMVGIATVVYLAIMHNLGRETRLGWLLLLLPLSVFIGGLVGAWGSWCNRRKCYGAIAHGSMSQSISASVVNVAAGLLYPSALGLIAATILSQAANAISLMVGLQKKKTTLSSMSIAAHFGVLATA